MDESIKSEFDKVYAKISELSKQVDILTRENKAQVQLIQHLLEFETSHNTKEKIAELSKK